METMEQTEEQKGNMCKDCGCACAACSGDCCGKKKHCSCPHHKAVPVLIVLIALTFLLGTWGILSAGAVNVVWPILLAAIGFTKMNASKCTCC